MAQPPFTPHDKERLDVLAGIRGSGQDRAVRLKELSNLAGQVATVQSFATAPVNFEDVEGTVGESQLISEAVYNILKAAGLAPVEVVNTLPTTGNFVGRTVFLTTDSKLYRWDGTQWTAAVDAADVSGVLDVANFATTLRPVEVVSSLPTTGNFEGRMVYLTTDDKLYRHTGSPTGSAGFTAAVPAVDVTGQLTNAQIADVAAAKLTGQITTTQITDNAVTTAKVNAGAVTTAKLAAGAVTADTIAANAITTAKINAGAVTANEIAANAITSAKIAADAVTAGKIAAGAITASEIAAGAITASKIAVSDFTNLVPDSEMADSGVWPSGSGSEFSLVNPSTSGFISRGHIRRPSGFATTGDRFSLSQVRFSVKAEEEYWWQYQVLRVGGTTMRSAGQIIWYNAAGTQLTAPVLGNYAANTTAGVQVRNGVVAPPANAVSGAWRWIVRGEDTDSEVQLASPEIRIRNGGELIVDGSITANKIMAGTITSDRLDVNAVTAGVIAAGAISGDLGHISSFSVNTLQIKGQAVTVPVRVLRGSRVGLTTTSWVRVASVSIPRAQGFQTLFQVAFALDGAGTQSVRVRILRASTQIFTAAVTTGPNGAQMQAGFPAIDANTAAGATTYHLEVARGSLSGKTFQANVWAVLFEAMQVLR